jgi:hypothetical protein
MYNEIRFLTRKYLKDSHLDDYIIISVRSDTIHANDICFHSKTNYKDISSHTNRCHFIEKDIIIVIYDEPPLKQVFAIFSKYSRYYLSILFEKYVQSKFEQNTISKNNPFSMFEQFLFKSFKIKLNNFKDHITTLNSKSNCYFIIVPLKTTIEPEDILEENDIAKQSILDKESSRYNEKNLNSLLEFTEK